MSKYKTFSTYKNSTSNYTEMFTLTESGKIKFLLL